MTQYRTPDYYILVDIGEEQFKNIAGIAISVTVVCNEINTPMKGMIIIPQGNSWSLSSPKANAWLWLDSQSIKGTSFKITIGKCCDPMYEPAESVIVEQYEGTVFKCSIEEKA